MRVENPQAFVAVPGFKNAVAQRLELGPCKLPHPLVVFHQQDSLGAPQIRNLLRPRLLWIARFDGTGRKSLTQVPCPSSE